MGAALILSASFGLLACGDDSSSGTFDSGKEDSNIEKKSQINEEIEKLTEKISTMQSEYQKATKDFGSCDSENEDETKTATIADKKYKFTCDGYDWTCEEFDEDLDKVTADMQKLAYELATMDNETTGCNFKITDKTWSYGYTQNAGNETSKTSITVKINGDKYTTTTHMEVSGSSAAIACAYASELAEEGITCKGDVMITEDTDTGDIDGEEDLKDLFNNYMGSCQYLNGNFDWEPEEEKDDEDVDKPSKDEDSDEPVVKPSKDEKDDSDSDEPEVKPAKGEKDDEDDEMTVVCELEESADQWKVLLDYGYDGGTGKTWTWTSETSVTVNTFSYTETSSESECEEMLQFTANASCDGTKFIKSVGEEKVEDTSKESMLASAQSTCDMYKTIIED